MRICFLMFILCSAGTAFGWTLYVTNWTNKVVNIHTSWAGSGWAFGKCFSCCNDHATIQPGQRISINAGACLLTELRVDGGSSYTSSGQSFYKELHIIGPVNNGLYAGRIGDELNDRTGKLNQGQLLNATSYPATNVKIEIADFNNPENYRVIKPDNADFSIPAGKDFVFDITGGHYIRRIEMTLNNKNIVHLPQFGKGGEAGPRISSKFFISGPPDGSNPKIIKLIQ